MSEVDRDFRARACALLTQHEGRSSHVHFNLANAPSIGIGIDLRREDARELLAAVGADYDEVVAGNQDLSDSQIDALFERELEAALAGARRLVPNFDQLAVNARLVIVDMMFMGEPVFAGFTKMIAALIALDYGAAADEMVSSRWYEQVKTRAIECVALMRSAA